VTNRERSTHELLSGWTKKNLEILSFSLKFFAIISTKNINTSPAHLVYDCEELNCGDESVLHNKYQTVSFFGIPKELFVMWSGIQLKKSLCQTITFSHDIV
jgi:hypothetical protein